MSRLGQRRLVLAAAALCALTGCVVDAQGLLARDAYPDEYEAARELWEASMGPLSDRCDREWRRARILPLPAEDVARLCMREVSGCVDYVPEAAWETGSYPLVIAVEEDDPGRTLQHELGHLGGHCTLDDWDYGHCSAYFEARGEQCTPVPRRVTGRN